MKTVNVHEAKTTLSALLAAVEAGEEVVIARNGTPVAKLVRVEARRKPRRGILKTLPGSDHSLEHMSEALKRQDGRTIGETVARDLGLAPS